MTQREFVLQLRQRGLAWSHSQLASIEAGRREDIELSTLVLLTHAAQTTIHELLSSARPIKLTDEWAASSGLNLVNVLVEADERLMLTGEHGQRYRQHVADQGSADPEPIDADVRLAERLDIPMHRVLDAARDLWGHSLTRERNLRVIDLPDEPEEVRRTRRGHITRQLTEELVARFEAEVPS